MKRIKRELQEFKKTNLWGITAEPANKKDLFKWAAVI